MKDPSNTPGAVQRAKGPRYSPKNLKPLPPPDPSNPPRRNAIHSVLMALPIIMLVAGLYFYYQGEREEAGGEFLLAAQTDLQGRFEGISVVKSGISDQHFLWVHADERLRGIRMDATLRTALATLKKGDALEIVAAPKVAASRTLWLYSLSRNGDTLLDGGQPIR